MVQNNRSRALYYVIGYLRPHSLRLTVGLTATIAASLLGAIQPLLIRYIVDEAIPSRRWVLLALLTLGLALIPIVRLGLGTLQTFWINGTAQRVAQQLRIELLTHLLRMPLSFFNANKTGELMTRVANDTGRLALFVSDNLVPIIANTIQLLTLVGMLLYLDVRLSIAVIVIFPLFHLLGKLIGRRLSIIEDEWRSVRGRGSALLQEILTGVRTVKSFTREERETARWVVWNKTDFTLWLHRTNWSQILAGTNQAMVSVGVAIVMGYGGWQVMTDQMTLGTLLAFFALIPQFYSTCGALITSQVEIDNLEAYIARVFDILELPPEASESQPTKERPGYDTQSGCSVAFENVSFIYDGNRRQGITNLSFQIKAGEHLAIVGPSGGGKSTILDLLMSFYRPSAGRILLDGFDISEWPLKILRQQVAIVSQDVHVWNDTIRANLLYGCDAIDENQISQAVEAAQLTDFIASLPRKYETVVGERGVRLSGGERQRLSIARVLLRNPRLVLLDEITAALDALTEKALQETVKPYFKGKTVITVAHRLSSIMSADWVVVIADGRIMQMGDPEHPRAQSGMFQTMFDAQFGLR